MLSFVLFFTLSLAQDTAPVLVAVKTEGLPTRDREAVVGHIAAEVEGAGVVPTTLPPGVVTPACAADVTCARQVFAGGVASRVVFVEVLRAGSRASVAARVIDRDGRVVADHAAVVPMAMLVTGREQVLPDQLLAALAAPAASAATVVPVAPTTPAVETPPPPASTSTSTSTAPTPPDITPGADGGALDPGMPAVLGVGATAVGALFLIGGTAAALGQNAVRLDPNADGNARAGTAVSIPLSLGVASLGAAGVGVGVWLLMGDGDEASVVAGG